MHKITSYFYDMRKILTKIFWSQGTSQGSSGPGSQADVGLGACRFQILVIWALNEPPALTACETHAKNPKTAGAWSADVTDEKESFKRGPTHSIHSSVAAAMQSFFQKAFVLLFFPISSHSQLIESYFAYYGLLLKEQSMQQNA